MKKYFFILLVFLSVDGFGQKFLNGFVLDAMNNPVPYSATVGLFGDSTLVSPNDKGLEQIDSSWIEPLHYYNIADNTGAFHLLVEDGQSLNIKARSYGYLDRTLRLDSFPEEPIIINLVADSTILNLQTPLKNKKWYNTHPTTLSMGVSFHQIKYDEFESLLGQDNTEALRLGGLQFTLDYGKVFKRVYAALEFGISFPVTREESGVDIETNSNLFGMHLGYELVNSRISYILPKLSFKRYRMRLINSPDSNENIPLQNFLQDKDLDLRFIHHLADLGLTIGYKYRKEDWIPGAFIIFGVHSGYAISLNNNVNIKGLRSSISSEENIQIKRLHLNFFFRSYFTSL